VSEPTRIHLEAAGPRQRNARRSWQLLVGSLVALAIVIIADAASGPRGSGVVMAGIAVIVAASATLHRRDLLALEADRRAEAESLARILQGLSRSVSADAIVEAIVGDLAVATGADHVVVARRGPRSEVLEATLVSSRPGVPSSTTLFPITDLRERGEELQRARAAVPVSASALAWPDREPLLRPAALATGRDGGDGRSAAGYIRSEWPRATGPVFGPESAGGTSVAPALDLAPGWAIPEDPPAGRRQAIGPGFVAGTSRAAETAAAERIAARARDVYGLRHTLAAPLTGKDGVVGAIVVSRRTAEPWSAATRRILAGAAVEASAALSRAHSFREAETRATTDVLTGLPNRRYFDEFCGLLARRRRA
jgi:GAF domain-containing protein